MIRTEEEKKELALKGSLNKMTSSKARKIAINYLSEFYGVNILKVKQSIEEVLRYRAWPEIEIYHELECLIRGIDPDLVFVQNMNDFACDTYRTAENEILLDVGVPEKQNLLARLVNKL